MLMLLLAVAFIFSCNNSDDDANSSIPRSRSNNAPTNNDNNTSGNGDDIDNRIVPESNEDSENTPVAPTSPTTPASPPFLNPNIITENGNININAVRAVNPNFSLQNLSANGDAALELLNDDEFRSLTMQVVSVRGSEPSDFAKQTLLDFIEARLNKPDGVTIVETLIDSPNVDSYSIERIFADIEVEHRTQFNRGSNLTIFIFFADADNENTNFQGTNPSIILGTAYLNTSFVIYKSTLERLTRNAPAALPRIETTTLIHELCHLMGLVNTSEVPQQTEHEDTVVNDDGEEVGNNHCNVPFCLMEATARLIPDMMGSIEVLQLDPLCIQDLQAAGGR